jgi:uncharacterized protein
MNYRRIPNFDIKVSEIGLGCEHLLKKDKAVVDEVIGAALDGGINILDVFMPQPEVRSLIGSALLGVRQKIYLQGHIGAAVENGQYKRSREVNQCDVFIQDFLTRFNTDYLDFGMIHFVDDLDDWHAVENQGVLEYAHKLKEKGVIRAIGMSSHQPLTALTAVQSGHIDVLLFSINPSFDLLPEKTQIDALFDSKTYDQGGLDGTNPLRHRLYAECARRGVAITVMKTLSAGKLLSAADSPLGAPLTVGQCEHYVLSRPAVVSALIGCATGAEVGEALKYSTLSSEEKDYTGVLANSNRYAPSGNCMYCNHCLPCPEKIDIASVHKYYDLAKNQAEVPETIRQHYLALDAYASDCIECGSCEDNCPFKVEVCANMAKAMELFGQ